MALNTSKRAVVEQRRQQVTKLRIDQGLTQRQIAERLSVSLGTVNRDLKALDMRWRKAADLDVETHRAHQLAEIERVKRWAWLDVMGPGRMHALLAAIKLEAQITGTIQPPSFVFNFGIFQQFIKAVQDDPSVGESFADWFKTYNAQKQQEGVRLEAQGSQHD